MNLEANKTYVFIDDASKRLYKQSNRNNASFIERYYEDGFTISSGCMDSGWGHGRLLISNDEIQYFKLKEPKMLKPDEKVTVEMTALELVKLRHLMDGVGSGDEVSFVAALDAASKFTSRKPNAKHWDEDSEFHIWCLAQFQDPKQDRIDALKKTIADAAAQIAAIRAESK
jgi:hypothetical protein